MNIGKWFHGLATTTDDHPGRHPKPPKKPPQTHTEMDAAPLLGWQKEGAPVDKSGGAHHPKPNQRPGRHIRVKVSVCERNEKTRGKAFREMR